MGAGAGEAGQAGGGGVRRGRPWGESVPPPVGLVSVGSDVATAAEARSDLPVRLTAGDVLSSLGGPSVGPLVNRFAIDVLRVRADDDELVAIAHVVVRGRTWWRGPVTAVLNVDRLGRWDAAPRAHPGDGRFDVVEVDAAMSLRARWQARRRLPSGTHVPHPLIRTSQHTTASWAFAPERRLWLDGIARGPVHELEVTIEPAGAIVYT
ncbi:MAG: hypothetical protein ACR2HP_04335 [Ilumatobacteraceae bacterium]